MNLRAIFNNLTRHCDKVEHYFPLYEFWFQRFKGKSPKILEIGIRYGGSAEMWRKYFGDGTLVHGVDIDPGCMALESDYLKVHIGHQGSVEFWRSEFIDRGENGFDIIMDDGSHENYDQICTFDSTFKNLLKDGGIYWCEDTHTSYYNGVRVSGGGYKNQSSFIEYVKNLVDVINSKHTQYAIGIGPTPRGPHVPAFLLNNYYGCVGIHFYDSIVVIEKEQPRNFVRVVSNPISGVTQLEIIKP